MPDNFQIQGQASHCQRLTNYLNHASVAPEGGTGATAAPSGNLSLPVGEKLTIRRGFFTGEHIYTLYKLLSFLAKSITTAHRVLSSRQI